MATTHSKASLFALLILLTLSSQVLAGRHAPSNEGGTAKQQPEVLKPETISIGGVRLPSFRIPSFSPYTGNGRYIPGNDDTFVPNPGYEVPNPNYRGGGNP
ncbi:hypothetical protein LINGRAHAP2_LOCUS28843 [Linum grandiflorum]